MFGHNGKHYYYNVSSVLCTELLSSCTYSDNNAWKGVYGELHPTFLGFLSEKLRDWRWERNAGTANLNVINVDFYAKLFL
jgi:hypothetical protein